MKTLSIQQGLRFRQVELAGHINGDSFNRLLRISAISAGFVLLLGISMFGLRGLSLSKSNMGTMRVAATAGPSSGPSAISSMLGVNIANNGSVVVNGASVVAISDNSMQIKIAWGPADFSWLVETSGTTKFFDQKGQKQTFSYIKVGDIVMVTGRLASGDNQLVINADFVRE